MRHTASGSTHWSQARPTRRWCAAPPAWRAPPDAVWQIGAREWARTHCPGLQRMAQPEEIASAALMLASADHPYMTGAAFVIDGGKTAQAG